MLPMSGGRGIVLRIEHLPTSRLQKLVSLAPNDTLERAKTLFWRHKYRQLPVLADASTPIGAVTQESVLSAGLTSRHLTLASVMRPVMVVEMKDEVRKVLSRTSLHRFVLVRDGDGTISGIVTLSDVNTVLQEVSDLYLLIGEIELRLRELLTRICPSTDELRTVTGRSRVRTAHELALGDLEKALCSDVCWARLGWHIDRKVFASELSLVRNIRNDFAHYRVHGLPEASIKQLVEFLEWVEELTREC
ncbi:CBS domain-containing protein [Streptosporangium sandarakinum]